MHIYRKTIWLFLAGLILLYPQNSHAVSCSPNSGGGYTISSSCTFPYTVDGVENGNMTVQGGTTLTVNAGQTIIYNPEYSIAVNGTIALNASGQIKQGYIYIKDADSDGYPDDTTTFSATQVDGTYRRRYLMSSISGNDCSATTAAFQEISVIADVDQDGYGTGGSGGTCVGGSSVVSGRTYYLNGATSAYTYLASGQNLGTDCNDASASAWQNLQCYADNDSDTYGSTAAGPYQVCSGASCSGPYVATGTDCNDASASAWRNRYRDVDGDSYGVSSTICVGNDAGYVDNNADCDDTTNTKWQTLSCYADADNDAYTTGGAVNVCKGSACTSPSGHRASVNGADCDDGNASTYQSLTGYVDGDGDGYGAGGLTSVCSGASLPGGYVVNNSDCYDSNANAKPGQTSYFTTNRGDGSYDFNCDSSSTQQVTCLTNFGYISGCYDSSSSPSYGSYLTGWYQNVPSCGGAGTFYYGYAGSGACGGSQAAECSAPNSAGSSPYSFLVSGRTMGCR